MKDSKFLHVEGFFGLKESEQRLTRRCPFHINTRMPTPVFEFPNSRPNVVGSFGDVVSLHEARPDKLASECDIAEIRLDLFVDEIAEHGAGLWEHIRAFPLLFTARCGLEGSPADLTAPERTALLEMAFPDASLFDIELSSAREMSGVIDRMKSSGLPWIASYHNFEKLPSVRDLEFKATDAKDAGAVAFKCAARMMSIDDVAELVKFQKSASDIPVASMGMGALGPASRLLCAQAGSVLNYGFIGSKETAPGQWSAKQLLENIRSLEPIT